LERAAVQHGVVALAQIVAAGLSDRGVRSAVVAGRLHRVHQGVYAAGRPDLTPRGRWMAAVLACGDGAALSYASGAALRGLRQTAAAMIDVTVPRPSPISRPGIRIHRHPDLKPADIDIVDGIPVTSVSRTLLGLATFLRESALERPCDQAVILDQFDMREMEDLLKRSRGRRGVARLRNVLARGDLGSNVPASGLEIRYRDLCARAGLPKPEINRHILLGDEYHKVDFLWRGQRVVIETDGNRYHSTGWQRARDARRDELLSEHGYHRARIPDGVIELTPGVAVETARSLLRHRLTAVGGR
jgi:very-short-patch-repair endonuclease